MSGETTVTQLIALGDALKTLSGDVKTEPARSVLPQGCPLYTTINGAMEIFNLGDNTIRSLIRRNADFPAVQIGRKYIIDVPGFYTWLSERHGQTINEEG